MLLLVVVLVVSKGARFNGSSPDVLLAVILLFLQLLLLLGASGRTNLSIFVFFTSVCLATPSLKLPFVASSELTARHVVDVLRELRTTAFFFVAGTAAATSGATMYLTTG
jgi:hypothetical protein